MTENVIFDISDACSIRWNQFCSILNNFKKNFSKIPMKYSKNGQKYTMSKNTSNMLFETCWTLCKKPHFSTQSRSRYTFFWMTRYFICSKWDLVHNISVEAVKSLEGHMFQHKNLEKKTFKDFLSTFWPLKLPNFHSFERLFLEMEKEKKIVIGDNLRRHITYKSPRWAVFYDDVCSLHMHCERF